MDWGLGKVGKRGAEEGCRFLKGDGISTRVEVEWVRGVGVLKVKDRNLVVRSEWS